MIVLISGDRKWEGADPKSPLYFPSRLLMMEFMQSLPWDTIIREGCAPGADRAAEQIATTLGLEVHHYPADWERHAKRAGPIRNRAMYWAKDRGWRKPDLVAAFHNHIEESTGTKDMIEIAKQFGTEWRLYGIPNG